LNIKMKMAGLKALEGSLRDLQKEYGGKAALQAMRPAMKAAIDPLKAPIQSNTPVDSGGLKESVKVKIGKPSNKMVKTEHYNKNTVIYGQVGWFWSKPSLWFQAVSVEYGNVNIPAHRPLSNALESGASRALQRFKDKLGPSIEKKAKSLAKKRAK
jgi:hypothetical protein